MFRSTARFLVLTCYISIAACEPAEDAEVASDSAVVEDRMPDAGAASSDSVETIVRVSLREWAIGLSQSTVPAGQIRFEVTNEGQYEHAFEVEGGGIEEETDRLARGATTSLTVNLQPGTYELYCPVEDTHGEHEALGMRTTLVVQ